MIDIVVLIQSIRESVDGIRARFGIDKPFHTDQYLLDRTEIENVVSSDNLTHYDRIQVCIGMLLINIIHHELKKLTAAEYIIRTGVLTDLTKESLIQEVVESLHNEIVNNRYTSTIVLHYPELFRVVRNAFCQLHDLDDVRYIAYCREIWLTRVEETLSILGPIAKNS